MSSYNSEEEVWKLPEQDFTWDVTSELALYQALMIHKPAGINKHFNVALVSEKLTEQLGKPVLAGSIWKKLKYLYDLRAVEDREESIPFSLEVKDFCLPRKEFEALIVERQCDWREKNGARYYSSRTPTTPKSEGSESRSSPYHRDIDIENSDDDEDVDSDLERESDFDEVDDENSDQCEVESTKSEGKPDEEESRESRREKDSLIAEARDEIEKKLKEKLKEDEKEKDKPKMTPKGFRTEPKTPKDEDKIAPKRHITRSTPGSTPSSTPNKRRK